MDTRGEDGIPSFTDCRPESVTVDQFTGDVICKDNGLVIDRTVNMGPEWRHFPDSPVDRRRAAPGGHSKPNNMGTHITAKDAYRFRGEDRDKYYRAQRLRRANILISYARNRQRLLKSYNMLQREASRLGLPRRSVDTAYRILEKAIRQKLGRGERIKYYVAASLFIAARIEGIALSFEEVVKKLFPDERDGSGLNRHKIYVADAYRKLRERVKVKRYTVMRPIDYVSKAANELKLSFATERLMYRLARAVQDINKIHGKNPNAIAAAMAYIASSIMGEKKNQKEIAKKLGTYTDVAIRNRYRAIISKIHIDVAL